MSLRLTWGLCYSGCHSHSAALCFIILLSTLFVHDAIHMDVSSSARMELNLKMEIAQPTSQAEDTRLPVIVDTGGGLDDLAALALLCNSEAKINLLLVTTVLGSCRSPALHLKLLRRILDSLGESEVKIVPGADRPMDAILGPEKWLDKHEEKLRNAVQWFGLGQDRILEGSAEGAAINMLEAAENYFAKHKRKVKILVLGPATNIAYAAQHFKERLQNVVDTIVMSADINDKATNDGPKKPFNVRQDEKAFESLLNSELPLVFVRPTDIPEDPLSFTEEDLSNPYLKPAARILLRFGEPSNMVSAPRTGKEHDHLKQDPVVAYFLIDPAAFSFEQYKTGIARAYSVDFRRYKSFLLNVRDE